MPGRALSVEEREEIRIGLEAGERFAELARALGRPTSTISREVHRNGGRCAYRAVSAERRAVRKRHRPKLTLFQESPGLADHVEARLRALDSPTTIAIELARSGGIDGLMVSPETIYQGIYAQGRRGLAAGLGGCLHRKRRRRRPRVRAGEPPKPGPLGTFNLIGLRGEIAALRSEVGHFEGDLIIGAGGRSAVVTLVDRMSRYNLLGELPHGHDATSVLAWLTGLLKRVPEALRRTLTWDSHNVRDGRWLWA